MTATPVWFGSTKRPLLGWFHTPDAGHARAGVVICPPLGREYLRSQYALRLLAEGLASRGLCAFRFDYDGTGDSSGDERDPGRVAAWIESVTSALALVRRSAVPAVAAVGMRLGATFAAMAARQQGDLDALVLWDPVFSGRAYLAEQRAMSALSFGVPSTQEDGSVEAPGTLFDAATVRDLQALTFPCPSEPLARQMLVLTRSDPSPSQLFSRPDLVNARWEDAPGQAALLDVASPWQVLPHQTIQKIADWLSQASSAAPRPVQIPDRAGAAIVSGNGSHPAVVETPMFVGPVGLFGILSEVSERVTGPTVLFVSVANQHRIGPNRLWVDLARRWAGAGVRSFRFDLSGVGDSPVRWPGQPPFVSWAPEAFDDVMDAARALVPSDPSDVVLIGHSASGYQVLDSALQLVPRGVVSINPVMCFRPPELAAGRPLDRRRRSVLAHPEMVAAFQGRPQPSAPPTRRSELVWRGQMLLSPRRRSSSWLGRLVESGVDVLLVCGGHDGRPIRLGTTARRVRNLSRTGLCRFEHLDELEHGLMISSQRLHVAQMVTDHVLGRFGPDRSEECRVSPSDRRVVPRGPEVPACISEVAQRSSSGQALTTGSGGIGVTT